MNIITTFKHIHIYYLFNLILFEVCTILDCSILLRKRLGALTSKPFAYRVWPWELFSSYISDLTSVLAEKLWVDLKGLEIIRMLPWIYSPSDECWISDKSRFFFDGLVLNWITRFFIWKKLIFLTPLLMLLLNLQDALFSKYFFNKNIYIKLIKYTMLSRKKESFFKINCNYYNNFFFYEILNNNFFNYQQETISNKKSNLLCVRGLFLPTFLSKRSEKNVSKTFNKYFNNRIKKSWKVILYKQFLKKFNSLFSFSSSTNLFQIFLNCLPKKESYFNFFLDPYIDILSSSLEIFSKTTNISLFFLKLQKFFFGQTLFNNLYSFENFFLFKFILLINVNLWLINPKIHVFIRKVVKQKDVLVISIANSDSVLFKHLYFNYNFSKIQKLLLGNFWLNSFFSKKTIIAIFLNFDNLTYSSKIFITTFKNLQKIIFFKKKLLTNNHYFFNYIYYLSNYPFANLLNVSLPHFLKTKQKKDAKYKWGLVEYSSKIFIFTNEYFNKLHFFLKKKTSFLKKNFLFLIESNLTNINLNSKVDCLLPLNALGESFSTHRNYFLEVQKSLFLKYGPKMIWNLSQYLVFFFNLKSYPFIWLKNHFYTTTNINFTFYNSYLFLSIRKFSSLIPCTIANSIKKNVDKFIFHFFQLFFLDFQRFYLEIIILDVLNNLFPFIRASRYLSVNEALKKKSKVTFTFINN